VTVAATGAQAEGPLEEAGPRPRVANAPVSFGVDEILVDDALMPGPEAVLDLIAELGFEGTELGPPGFLGDGATVRRRLADRRLELVGSFLPLHLSRPERMAEDLRWLREALALVREATPEGSRPLAILSDHFDEPDRLALAGRIADHPEAWLPPARFRALVDGLHRAAEVCRSAGFEPVVHPHAGTYIETRDETCRLLDAVDPALVGWCLDTGHARFGGAEPVELARDYRELLRHVHLKDCRTAVLDEVAREGLGMEAALVRGAFVELGAGDSGVGEVIAELRSIGYGGWLVVEQDRFLFATDTIETLRASQDRNRSFLRSLGL
jgi:inosose dehydratase